MVNSKKKLRENVADILEIPQELVSGIVKLTMWSDGRLLMENHQGIVEYGPQYIILKYVDGTLGIRGEDLNILSLAGEELKITGSIKCVEFLTEE
ncbi:MAG: YabP/YqfC family sporulation protein [Bacillota bacterium]|jgi:sporulation protein YqfC